MSSTRAALAAPAQLPGPAPGAGTTTVAPSRRGSGTVTAQTVRRQRQVADIDPTRPPRPNVAMPWSSTWNTKGPTSAIRPGPTAPRDRAASTANASRAAGRRRHRGARPRPSAWSGSGAGHGAPPTAATTGGIAEQRERPGRGRTVVGQGRQQREHRQRAEGDAGRRDQGVRADGEAGTEQVGAGEERGVGHQEEAQRDQQGGRAGAGVQLRHHVDRAVPVDREGGEEDHQRRGGVPDQDAPGGGGRGSQRDRQERRPDGGAARPDRDRGAAEQHAEQHRPTRARASEGALAAVAARRWVTTSTAT